MDSRELVYLVYEGGVPERTPLHFESVDKVHEARLGDVLLGHGWVSLWQDWFYEGGPFHRRENEGLRDWVERLDVDAGFDWPSVDEVVESCVKNYEENLKGIPRKGLFVVFEVVGPTEYAEYSMMPPRPESGFVHDLAFHRLDFSKLLILDRKKAVRLYDKLAEYTLEVVKRACELDEVDGVRVADDAFTYTGPMYPPWFMDNHYLRWHEKFVNAIKARGKKALLHCDGDVTARGYVSKLTEIYDGIHPLDLCSKSTVESALKWASRVIEARKTVGWSTVFHTGIPIDLIMNNDVTVEGVERVVGEFLSKHTRKMLVLSVTHRPYPGRSFAEPDALSKVNAIRKLVGLPPVSL